MTHTQSMDPADAFARLGRIKFSETNLKGVLAEVSELAKRAIPGTSEVSVTLVGANGAHTAAYTGELAVAVDEVQYEQGHGPCLTAAAAEITVLVTDLANESRWPDWARRAIDAGVHSSMSIGLPLHESVTGALNIYSTKLEAFDDDAVALARTFADYAAVAMANAHMYDAKSTLAQHMQAAMESRAVIEQAKGIIMADQRCSAEEAFIVLSKISQDSNRKVRDVAAAVVARTVQSRKR